MTKEDWGDLNVGDVLQNVSGQTYVVVDSNVIDRTQVYVLSRTVLAHNWEEWERKRKTVPV